MARANHHAHERQAWVRVGTMHVLSQRGRLQVVISGLESLTTRISSFCRFLPSDRTHRTTLVVFKPLITSCEKESAVPVVNSPKGKVKGLVLGRAPSFDPESCKTRERMVRARAEPTKKRGRSLAVMIPVWASSRWAVSPVATDHHHILHDACPEIY